VIKYKVGDIVTAISYTGADLFKIAAIYEFNPEPNNFTYDLLRVSPKPGRADRIYKTYYEIKLADQRPKAVRDSLREDLAND